MDRNRLRRLLVVDSARKRMIATIIFIYIGFALSVYFFVDKLIFLPQPSSYKDTKEIIKMKSADGIRLSALYLPNSTAKYTLLYAHGNAEDLGDIRPRLEKLRKFGLSIFAYDYRGYGTSEGTPTERNAYKDIDTAYNYLTQQLLVSPERIIAFGRSVGGGSAVDLASRKSVAGLVMESAFTTAFRVKVPFPILPFDRFNNIDKIKRVKSPVLVMHGTADDVIPFWHGEQLFAAARSPKLSLWVEGANHNDFDQMAGERYGATLREFLNLVEKTQMNIN